MSTKTAILFGAIALMVVLEVTLTLQLFSIKREMSAIEHEVADMQRLVHELHGAFDGQ